MPASSLARLQNIATELRIDSVRSTTQAGSGHPTTCLSAADIVAALFFAEMRFDPLDPHAMADAIVWLLNDADLRRDLVHRGMARASMFSWQTAAARVFDVYREVLESAA